MVVDSDIKRLGFADFPVQHSLRILESDAATSDKREAMSSIGRKRDPQLKGILIKYTADPNPEVAMQAIRGLLVFRKDPIVHEYLATMCEHQNDMIREVVQQEIYGNAPVEEDPHAASPNFMKNVVVQGDVLDILKNVPDRAIHLTFTSPPYYNARDYSIYKNYSEYLDFLESVFSEVHRITKEGRFFVLNTSPVIVPRAGRKYSSRRYPVPFDIHARLVKMGWEFIDDIIWAKPEKSAKNRVAGFEMHRKPLTYKANARTEYVMVYRKKSFKLIDWNLRQYSMDVVNQSRVNDDFERSNVWNIAPVTDRVHSAVFPLRLCDHVVRLYSFVGDLVFDPFAGSGTLGKAALRLGRHFFMTEIREDYVGRIQENIKREVKNYKSAKIMALDAFTRDATKCR
ncbi:MAG: restriction endonuclease subunit M [Dehalococcoidia bacterium]|nr:restriction endonuclease subunit M [Dehalococcoidia bacterium]